ncbi:MAG: heme lyase CcmF/NrfE family subunit, partial [Candidatus Marinimicrobia bacterium]|nr:heme lyase CcmF/NrfE family subunit [Candidatus Neomarinimicrobiota bacterium]
MTPVAGGYALNLALGFCLFSIIAVFWYHVNKDVRLYLTAQRLVLGTCLFIGFATFVLTAELLNSNFDIDYVAHYTSLETPAVYKLTALWAGQEGSLLFWLFILSIYAG